MEDDDFQRDDILTSSGNRRTSVANPEPQWLATINNARLEIEGLPENFLTLSDIQKLKLIVIKKPSVIESLTDADLEHAVSALKREREAISNQIAEIAESSHLPESNPVPGSSYSVGELFTERVSLESLLNDLQGARNERKIAELVVKKAMFDVAFSKRAREIGGESISSDLVLAWTKGFPDGHEFNELRARAKKDLREAETAKKGIKTAIENAGKEIRELPALTEDALRREGAPPDEILEIPETTINGQSEVFLEAAMEAAVITAALEFHEENKPEHWTRTVETLENFYKGEKFPWFREIEAIARNRTYPSDQASRAAHYIKELIHDICVPPPKIELTPISYKYHPDKAIPSMLSKARKGILRVKFSSEKYPRVAAAMTKARDFIFKGKTDLQEEHQKSGQAFIGRVLLVSKDDLGRPNTLSVEQLNPKSNQRTIHMLEGALTQFCITHASGKELDIRTLEQGKKYSFRFPKLFHEMSEKAIERHCEVITAEQYVKQLGKKFPGEVSGKIVKIADGHQDGAEKGTIWIELPAAQKVKVKLLKLSPAEHGLTDAKLSLDSEKIKIVNANNSNDPANLTPERPTRR